MDSASKLDVLVRFRVACPEGAPEQVAEWRVRYPEMGAAIASVAAALRERSADPTYDELILGSDMTEERKAHWLSDP